MAEPQVCAECSALVEDMDKHVAWHKSLAGKVSRTIGGMGV